MARSAESRLRSARLRTILTLGVACAACALLVVSAPARPAAAGEAIAGISSMQPEQQLWRDLYAGLARRADLGDVHAAQLALQMRRHGVAVYGTSFQASAEQLERWRQVALGDDEAACPCIG